MSLPISVQHLAFATVVNSSLLQVPSQALHIMQLLRPKGVFEVCTNSEGEATI